MFHTGKRRWDDSGGSRVGIDGWGGVVLRGRTTLWWCTPSRSVSTRFRPKDRDEVKMSGVKRRHICGCQCNERLKAKTEGSTRLETKLRGERFLPTHFHKMINICGDLPLLQEFNFRNPTPSTITVPVWRSPHRSRINKTLKREYIPFGVLISWLNNKRTYCKWYNYSRGEINNSGRSVSWNL